MMADKEIFQNVNEIDLEALIDNIQEQKRHLYESYMYMTNYPVNSYSKSDDMYTVLTKTKRGEGGAELSIILLNNNKVQSCFLKR